MKANNKNVLFGLLILSSLLLNSETTTAQCHIDDWTALKALYESTDGDNWTINTDWQQILGNAPASNCDLSLLYGVSLDEQGRVTCLDFDGYDNCDINFSGGNNLNGSIPPELGNLSNLEKLSLSINDLIGSIPPELGNLSSLRELYLDNNELIGSIPPEFGNLSNLERLYLYNNELIGSIPPELGNLSNLQDLRLFQNALSGSIPPELGNLSNLVGLYLYENELSGSIPPELGNLSNLEFLNLFSTELSSSIPPELGNLSNLEFLSLSSNQLIGSIPPELGNLSNMQSLSLWGNELIGSIPPELGNLSNLQYLYLSSNELIGSIPLELGNLSNLEYLDLFNNQLIGSIPPELGNLSNLNRLEINDNDLSGCYSDNLAILCTQLNDSRFDGDADISVGNNFDAGWEDFCATGAGVCVPTFVYPGDLNNDGIVNNQDISLSGLFHSANGPVRITEHQNIDWYPHPSENWGVLNNQGIDIKHHDCNGDGVIDENDQQAIFENMDSIWKIPDPPPPSPSESDYQVMLHPIDQIYDGYLVMNVALERRTSGDLTLQGGHFTIDYSDVEGEFSFVELDFLPITWLGVPSQNLWFETTHYPEDKKIEVGFTKNNDTNSTGSGVIAQLILQYTSLARQTGSLDITYQFTVNTIGVHNNNGNFTPIEDQLLQVNLNSQCEPNWTIDEETPFQNKYKSSGYITTNGFVLIGEDQEMEYQANRITLNSGFSIKIGEHSQFRAGYGNCD